MVIKVDIQTLKVGMLQTNCYILTLNNESLIIDPGDNYELIKQNIKGKLIGILITHYHFDHVGALSYFKDIKTYDVYNLKEGTNRINNFTFEMIKTPGHKEDLISFLFENKLFCGDFIFEGSIGRCDLKGGNFTEMKNSIKKILKYHNLIIYPGHGDTTTLEKERRTLERYI